MKKMRMEELIQSGRLREKDCSSWTRKKTLRGGTNGKGNGRIVDKFLGRSAGIGASTIPRMQNLENEEY